MPHTSHRRKKQPVTKRVEVTDDDGWTRVTSTNRDQQIPRQAEIHGAPTNNNDIWQTTPEDGVTVEKTREEFAQIEKRWEESDACKTLIGLLKERVLSDGRCIDKCIMFGSASFCGLRKGWISMKTAAMGQLAAFRAMHSTIEQVAGAPVPAYAQDPAYNDIDTEFLKSMEIEVVKDPRGFGMLTSKSLAYTPTAELHVELQTLGARPAIRLGSKLDFYWRNEKGLACTNRVALQDAEAISKLADIEQQARIAGSMATVEEECQCFETFLRDREGASVPRFDIKDASPLRDQHLYWLKSLEDGDSVGEAQCDSRETT